MDKYFAQFLFPFPSQKLVRKYLPKRFQKYSPTRIIIDGTEIFVERGTSMKTHAQVWSDCKHHNTWKALVGISLNGIIDFVSCLKINQISDKELTKCSGLLKKKLKPEDNVMTDKVFDITDTLSSEDTLNIPPFKGGRKQFNLIETDDSARTAAVRIHVGRANKGRIKNCHTLNENRPLSMTPLMNQVFTSCRFLTNFYHPLYHQIKIIPVNV